VRITLSGAIAVLVVCLIALIAFLAMLAAAYAAPASPSPLTSPTATPAPLPTPAAPELVAWATKWKHRAGRAREALCRVRSCFGDHMPAQLADAPVKGSGVEAWTKAGRRWTRQRTDWAAKVKAGRAKMRNPGGTSCGTRWIPLLRWTRWPERVIPTMTAIIMRESSGRPKAVNPASGCTGLLQILRANCSQPWRLTDPEYNLRVGLRLYREAGLSPWAL
jgi:hypothetical protein